MSMILFSNREFKLEINFRLSYSTSQTCGWHCTNYQYQAETKTTASGNHAAGPHRSHSPILCGYILFGNKTLLTYPEKEDS